MSSEPGFEMYLKGKKIDAELFKQAEPEMWASWKQDFDEMHPNSFTVQKLNLINPIRRKYPLRDLPGPPADEPAPSQTPSPAVPAAGKPVIRPRPKMG